MKDTNNLLSYNQWTCGDYNGLNEFNTNAQLTNKYSYTGEYSIQCFRASERWWVDTNLQLQDTGKYTLTANILNNTGVDARLRLMENGEVLSNLFIPSTTQWVTYSLTGTFTSLSNCRIRFLNYGVNDLLFIDNISLNKS